MAKDPAILFYTSDFFTGTATMTNEEVGMYIRLLCLQHQKGRLSEKDMKYICSTYVEDVYKKFNIDDNGLFYNVRMEEEINKRVRYSESRRANIRKRYQEHGPTYVGTHVLHMENENENENINTNLPKNEEESKSKNVKKKKPGKELSNKKLYLDTVYLTQEEYDRLLNEWGKQFLDAAIAKLDGYLSNNEKKKRQYKDHNKVLRGWVRDGLEEKGMKPSPKIMRPTTGYQFKDPTIYQQRGYV